MERYPRWRRRQTLVNREYQLRFSTVLLVQMTTVILAIAAFAFVESRSTMELILTHLADYPVPSYDMHLNNQAFLLQIILVIGIAAAVQIAFGIYASHKLAGPVLKITRALERASRGEFAGRVHFRRGDHLEDLADSLNAMLSTLETRQKRARDGAEEASRLIARLQGGEGGADDVQRLRQRLAELAGAEAQVPAGCGR